MRALPRLCLTATLLPWQAVNTTGKDGQLGIKMAGRFRGWMLDTLPSLHSRPMLQLSHSEMHIIDLSVMTALVANIKLSFGLLASVPPENT